MRKLENTRPDCILLDIMMPEMDGWMLLKQIKKNVRLKEVPVIIITVVPVNPPIFQDKEKLGYADYVNKPFTKSELLESLSALGIE